jgi:hypothetical protein
MIKHVPRSSRKVSFILVRLKWNLNILNSFTKYPQISNFLKIRPLGAKVYLADGRTDGRTAMTKLIVAFRKFANAPNNTSTEQMDNIIKMKYCEWTN